MEKIENFVETAVEKANHHAKNVLDTIPVLYKELVMFNTNFKKWRTTCLWIEINSKPYYITYDHDSKQILFKNKNNRGEVIFRFDDNVSMADISESIELISYNNYRPFND